MQTLRFCLALIRTSIRASISARGAFLLQSALLVLNNLLFFSMWWIFFRSFDNIGGWQLHDMAASMAMLFCGYGLSQICFGGVKSIGKMILQGDLDPLMVQPKNLFLHLASLKSRPKGWGHLATGLILFALGGHGASWPLLITLTLSGTLLFTAFGALVCSLTFWLGPIESLSQKYLDSLFVFAMYPTNMYSGLMQLVMFTLIPAGLIGYVPVELLKNFSFVRLLLLLLSSLSFLGVALWVFYRGLRRYESGNQIGMRF